MTKISPVYQLKMHTDAMIRSVIRNSPNAESNIGNFLRHTNENNLHGTSFVAFHSLYNKFKNASAAFSPSAMARTNKLPELIEEYVKNSPTLTKYSDEYLTKVEKNYPRSFDRRISLASQNSVDIDSVKPRSKFKKFFVILNQYLKD